MQVSSVHAAADRAAAIERDPRWACVLARDADADGRFWYAVQSTGVYCRPTCPSRRPRAQNVAFFGSCADAERAGYRPCRRCVPDATDRIRYGFGDSALGGVLVARSGEGVCAILFGDDVDALATDLAARFPRAHLQRDDASMRATVAAVADLIDAPTRDPQLPLDVRGTAFQRRVWSALRAIPRGATASYADIAARIGAPASVRAVAGACAANPLAVVVPCHRVVKRDGGLSGYRWGIERKRALLQREAAAT